MPTLKSALDGLHPIFSDVLSPGTVRYDLATPWHEGGYAYATDGRVLVRTPLDDIDEACRRLIPGRDDPGHGRRPKDLGSMFGNSGPYSDVAVDLPAVAGCEPCPECGGFGGVVLFDGPPLEFFPCQDCEGDLAIASLEPVPLGPATDGKPYDVAAWMVALLARHGAEVRLPIDPVTGLCRDAAMRFAVGRSVEGVAMPLAPRKERV